MNTAIILGDSTNNTLSVVRSLGKANVRFVLILVGSHDGCNVSKSKYVKRNRLIRVGEIADCQGVFEELESGVVICTFDEAAEWVDNKESELSEKHMTPCRGKRIGNLFNKDNQCELAKECGLTVPVSALYRRGDDLNSLTIPYPLILKPLYSTKGEKSDIHICHSVRDVEKALEASSMCNEFIVQEFIIKEYELDCIGVRTDNVTIVAGAVQKIRHYPDMIGAGAFGLFRPLNEGEINIDGLNKFLEKSNYHGPFSVEFLHTKEGKNYFMEVNFRNEGLAQVATDAGANLHGLYVTGEKISNHIKRIYMMNYSIDYLHVKEGRISKSRWWKDFFKTRSFINASIVDPMPVIHHYLRKLHLA